jgi:multiple sugar transport system permease protein
MGTNEVQWGLMAAATIVAIIPLFVLALAVQRYMIRGLTFGAVK